MPQNHVTWQNVALGMGSVLASAAVVLMLYTCNTLQAVTSSRCTDEDCRKLRESISENVLAIGKMTAHSAEREKRVDDNIENINNNIEKIGKQLERLNGP